MLLLPRRQSPGQRSLFHLVTFIFIQLYTRETQSTRERLKSDFFFQLNVKHNWLLFDWLLWSFVPAGSRDLKEGRRWRLLLALQPPPLGRKLSGPSGLLHAQVKA